MSDIVIATNFDDNVVEQSTITADALSGQPIVSISNPLNFSVNSFVLLGSQGGEQSEILQILSISDKTITFTVNLESKHLRNEPIYLLQADQVKFYAASAPASGDIPIDAAFSVIAGPVTISADQTSTSTIYSADGTQFWYKFTRYNSYSSQETSLSDSIAIRGGNFGDYVSITDIRDEAGMNDSNSITDDMLVIKKYAAQSEVKSAIAGAGYVLPLAASNGKLYTPPIVSYITRLLGAGLALMQDYGPTAPGDTKDGKQKITEARALLDKIANSQLVLVDYLDQQLPRSARVSGWPDDTTQDVGTDGVTPEPFKSTMSKVF